MRKLIVLLLLGLCPVLRAEISLLELSGPVLFSGCADASDAVALDNSHFVVANDEDNVLRIYSRVAPGQPVATLDLNDFLDLTSKSPEVDLEGAARIGDVIYWISSHGANKNGKAQPNRRRFFATRILETTEGISLEPLGIPYSGLVEDLAADARFERFNLVEAAKLAPKEPGALNIEGLAATPSGEQCAPPKIGPVVKR
jgi:hypothetical protein